MSTTEPGRGSVTMESRDPDEVYERVASLFSPHTLEILGPKDELDVVVRARVQPSITVAEIGYGAEILVRPDQLSSYYEINVPLHGYTISSSGGEEVESWPDRAAILDPSEPATMRWSAHCTQLAVKVSRGVVERTVEGVLGHPPDEAIRFAVGFDLTSRPGRNWLRAVTMLRDALDDEAPELVVRPLEELVVGQLLAVQPHTLSGRLAGDPRPARPRSVARVVDLIEFDPGAPLTASDLARASGVGLRSLQSAFAEHLGMSPTAYLRQTRLARAHQDLLAVRPGDGRTVSVIAHRWGFGHGPRFAAAYRERYGVLPSQTLRV